MIYRVNHLGQGRRDRLPPHDTAGPRRISTRPPTWSRSTAKAGRSIWPSTKSRTTSAPAGRSGRGRRRHPGGDVGLPRGSPGHPSVRPHAALARPILDDDAREEGDDFLVEVEQAVLPADAGVSRPDGLTITRFAGPPRRRGGVPAVLQRAYAGRLSSPPTRGCSGTPRPRPGLVPSSPPMRGCSGDFRVDQLPAIVLSVDEGVASLITSSSVSRRVPEAVGDHPVQESRPETTALPRGWREKGRRVPTGR